MRWLRTTIGEWMAPLFSSLLAHHVCQLTGTIFTVIILVVVVVVVVVVVAMVKLNCALHPRTHARCVWIFSGLDIFRSNVCKRVTQLAHWHWTGDRRIRSCLELPNCISLALCWILKLSSFDQAGVGATLTTWLCHSIVHSPPIVAVAPELSESKKWKYSEIVRIHQEKFVYFIITHRLTERQVRSEMTYHRHTLISDIRKRIRHTCPTSYPLLHTCICVLVRMYANCSRRNKQRCKCSQKL